MPTFFLCTLIYPASFSPFSSRSFLSVSSRSFINLYIVMKSLLPFFSYIGVAQIITIQTTFITNITAPLFLAAYQLKLLLTPIPIHYFLLPQPPTTFGERTRACRAYSHMKSAPETCTLRERTMPLWGICTLACSICSTSHGTPALSFLVV